MAVEVYLYFNGNCREAVEFYAQVFGTDKPRILTFGDTPPNPDYPLTEDMKKLVMHTFLTIKGSKVMFSDVAPGTPFTVGNNINLIVGTNDVEEIKVWFNQLKIGGTVQMDLQETFWSKCYGSILDKYGTLWQLNYDNGEKGM